MISLTISERYTFFTPNEIRSFTPISFSGKGLYRVYASGSISEAVTSVSLCDSPVFGLYMIYLLGPLGIQAHGICFSPIYTRYGPQSCLNHLPSSTTFLIAKCDTLAISSMAKRCPLLSSILSKEAISICSARHIADTASYSLLPVSEKEPSDKTEPFIKLFCIDLSVLSFVYSFSFIVA